MSDQEEESGGDSGATEEPTSTPEDEQDKVKPVVFIGLFITSLLGLGM